MYSQLLKYATVIFSSSLKFIFGPIEGFAMGLGWVETSILTISGMMLAVLIFTFFGEFMKEKIIKRFAKKRNLFNPKNRRNVRLWGKYGIYGVAFLTPILLTPIGGTILATSFGEKKHIIFLWMLLSGVIWGFTETWLVFHAQGWLHSIGINI